MPAIKPAAQKSKTGHIGLLATPGTVARQYTQDLISSFAGGCKVTLVGSSELVLIAEAKAKRQTVNHAKIASILAPINNTNLDTLVLGCTHFPLLCQEIDEALTHKVMLLDSGDAIATRVMSFMDDKGNEATEVQGTLKAGYTKEIDLGLKETLADYGFTQFECIAVAN